MFDFHLERVVELDELAEALAGVFSVSAESVRIVAELGGGKEPSWVTLLCTCGLSGGDFPQHLAVYPQARDKEFPSEAQVAVELTRRLGLRCLISGPSQDPYLWQLVDVDGARDVTVHVEALNRDELVLVGDVH